MAAPMENVPKDLYERFLENAQKLPLYHRRCALEERTAEDPGWPFLPEETYLLAEKRQLEPAEYHFTMGVLRGLRTIDMRALEQAIDAFATEKGLATGAAGAAQPDLDAAALDFRALADKEPPPRTFAWNPWIPARRTTLLHGFGGVGKSLLLQQILTAYALQMDLFGGATQGRPARPALLLAGEDDHDEVWRRAIDICRRLGASLADLPGKVDILAVPHLDITLAAANEVGAVTPAPMLDVLRARIERTKPGLIGLDNSAKLFAIKEGDRIGITRAIGLLDAVCHDFDATIVLAAHDNKGGDFSGSTAWENACRSRLHLTSDSETGTTILEMPKANYAATGRLVLRWDAWSFRAEDPTLMTQGERLDADMKTRRNAQTFLAYLDKLTAQGRTVSHSPQAKNYAPKIMANGGAGPSARELAAAMELLFDEERIKAHQPVLKSTDRHYRLGIVRCGSA
jgi:RecA-family ATPase